MKRPRLVATGVLLGTFLLGGLAGTAGGYAYSQRQCAQLIRPGAPHTDRRLRALARELGLTSEQKQQIEAILQRHWQGLEQARRKVFEQCGQPWLDSQQQTDEEIRAVLTPTQRERFDQLLERRDEWRGRRGLRRPGGFGAGRRLGRSGPGLRSPDPSATTAPVPSGAASKD